MTFGWSLLAIVGSALGLLIVRAVVRLVRDKCRTAHRPERWSTPDRDTTIAQYGHS